MVEAKALVKDLADIDIMSCSYGAPENAGFVKLSLNVFEALSEGTKQVKYYQMYKMYYHYHWN